MTVTVAHRLHSSRTPELFGINQSCAQAEYLAGRHALPLTA